MTPYGDPRGYALLFEPGHGDDLADLEPSSRPVEAAPLSDLPTGVMILVLNERQLIILALLLGFALGVAAGVGAALLRGVTP